jgi:hypothetical protein
MALASIKHEMNRFLGPMVAGQLCISSMYMRVYQDGLEKTCKKKNEEGYNIAVPRGKRNIHQFPLLPSAPSGSYAQMALGWLFWHV